MAYLEDITSPRDLRQLDYRQLEILCEEIREFLIFNVSRTGGHLSSNLGVVELLVALHRCFRSPQDVFVFDVGHQCYTHKLLTGRREGFARLRMTGGVSGFPNPAESKHDALRAGHASNAISAAVGVARAKKLSGDPGYVIAVVGDGALTGGMVYEGMNNIGSLNNLIIILNDNTMSISKNVGALAHYLTKLRTNPQYFKTKQDIKTVLSNTPVIGDGVKKSIQTIKSVVRKSLYHSTFFEEFGLRYIGPVDGHNLLTLCGLFSAVRKLNRPMILHVETQKGKGFKPAESNPGAFHGVGAFNARSIADPDAAPQNSFSTVFGQQLAELGEANPCICAITAAMKYGTGLQYFKKAHPDRFFDVGMAEEHAVTFASGLASQGYVPVVAIYSTFLQRSYDQIIHDAVLGKHNILFAVDRAGLVAGDGETHQGIYDAAFFSQQPDMPIISPANFAQLRYWLDKLLTQYTVPRVLRYPRGEESPAFAPAETCSGRLYEVYAAQASAKTAIVTYGIETAQARMAAARLAEAGVATDVVQLVQINPLPDDLLAKLQSYDALLFAEEGIVHGGIGEHLAADLLTRHYKGRYKLCGISRNSVPHATYEELLAQNGLDGESLAKALLDWRDTPCD